MKGKNSAVDPCNLQTDAWCMHAMLCELLWRGVDGIDAMA
jgi:hypothetical protein